MSNYNSLNRLCTELNLTLGTTSDTERENLIQSYYNQGLISYRQYYLYVLVLLNTNTFMIILYKCIVRIGRW